MIIDRFGDIYNSAQTLPQGAFVDEWSSTRPPVTAKARGMSGAFDFYGTDPYPLGPLIVRKNALLIGSSWADVETQLDDLIAATIMAGESKLWGLERDGTTKVWAYAKCTKLSVDEKATNAPTGVPVSLEFFCREGVWYGASGTVEYQTAGEKTLTNGGSGDAQIKFTFYNNSAGAITQVSVQHMGTYDYWTFDGAIPSGSVLVVDSANQTCTLDGVGAYSDLIVGTGQANWLVLVPGSNQILVSITPGTGPFLYEFAWTETG